MRLRHIEGAAEAVAANQRVIGEQEAPDWRGKWQQLFAAEKRPIHLEIGMGRGRFIIASAAACPDISFIGLELREEVIMQALERYGELPDNLRILWLNAAMLEEVFAPGEVERIYLNFPDPWPKNRHYKRRLTWNDYLLKYQHILTAGGSLRFKTDNRQLFDWSVERFSENGWLQQLLSYDLPLEDAGVISEYEARYRRRGLPIYCGQWQRPQLVSASDNGTDEELIKL